MLFHCNGADWTPTATGDAGLRDVVVATDDPEGLAVGGVVFGFAGGSWDAETTPTGENLTAVLRAVPQSPPAPPGVSPSDDPARTAVG